MIGGSGNYSTSHEHDSPVLYYKYHTFQLNGDVGYFFVKKMTGGIRISYLHSHNKTSYNDTTLFNTTAREINLGPFVRYYVLPAKLKYNLLIDAFYSFGRSRNKSVDSDFKDKASTYAFAAGPVWFINSTAALELTLSYEHRQMVSNFKTSYTNVNLGFKIHLDKWAQKSK